MVIKQKGRGFVLLTCKFYQEGRKWVAVCEELGTSTFGRSLPDAQRKIIQAIDLHLQTLDEVGESERFFKEHNIQYFEQIPRDVNICVNSVTEDVFFRPCIYPVREMAPV